MENFDYTNLIEVIITVLSFVITAYLIPCLKKKLSNEKFNELQKWVGIAVGAAEQIYGSKTGQEKREYVVAFLLAKGIIFDVDEVEAMIENEVHKLNGKLGKDG